jgi:oligogalacturonide lyase
MTTILAARPKARLGPPEGRVTTDGRTGARVRQVTTNPSVHHHPFFFVPAYDDAMRWLFFVSHRTGAPQAWAEARATGELLRITDRPDLDEWSVHPSPCGRWVYYTAGGRGWRAEVETGTEECVAAFGRATRLRADGMVAAGMGTTALSRSGRWWAVAYRVGPDRSELAVVDTRTGEASVTLGRDGGGSIGHMQFCPDDEGLLFYAGPLTDRVWLVNRDGSDHRRLYGREDKAQWVTHETWIPGRRELAFVDWPHGVRAVHADTGSVRWVARFNAWHIAASRDGSRLVADTNLPDTGLRLFGADGGESGPAGRTGGGRSPTTAAPSPSTRRSTPTRTRHSRRTAPASSSRPTAVETPRSMR